MIQPKMMNYVHVMLVSGYMLSPMNLIQCVTSIDNHIINLNGIFDYVFQQTFSIFMKIRVGEGLMCG